MKKLIMMAAIAVASVSANAQVWVGGALGYDYNKENGVADNYITISPEVGYNLDENWAIAIDINAQFRTGDLPDRTRLSVSPYARYTFFKSGIASLFVDGGFNVGSEKLKGQDSQTTWGVGLRPGIAISVAPKLTFVTKLAYLGYEKSDINDRSSFGLGVNNENLTFGLYYNF